MQVAGLDPVGSVDLIVRPLEGARARLQSIEVVERKGIGHPDTICDGIAEHVSLQLCRYYVERFGSILHHNVDKVLLCGGSARAAFGGGEVLEPIEIYLAGRATMQVRGERIPVAEIAVEACREWLRQNLPEIDLERHVKIFPRLRPGSQDLAALFLRSTDAVPANDTSCGVGFAPLTELERVVLDVERRLNDPSTKRMHPAIGWDVKVMGLRRRDRIELTIGCAVVARHVADVQEYLSAKHAVCTLALEAASLSTRCEVGAVVNAADDLERGEIYLTVTGTSAEAGDDGEVGRGNRSNGLITPYRPMTMEAAAGKNPVSHVGKLYNVIARQIAEALVHRISGVSDATCVMVSRIGQAVTTPAVVDLQLECASSTSVAACSEAASQVVRAELANLQATREALLQGRVAVY